MKKATILVMLFIVSILGSFSVGAVLNAPCGSSLPPLECQAEINCGAKKCTEMYKAIDISASAGCKEESAQCAKPEVIPNGCGEGVPLYICSTKGISSSVALVTDMEFTSCGGPACIAMCQTYIQSGYKTIESMAEKAASSFVSDLISGGSFLAEMVPCSEMDNCFQKVPKGTLKPEGFYRLKCNDIKEDTYKKIIEEYGKTNKADLENNLPFEKLEVQKALIGKSYEFENPTKFAEFLRNCGNCESSIGPKTLSSYVTQQKSSLLADKLVRDQMAFLGIKLPWWKQATVAWNVLNQNPFIRWGTRIAGVASTGYGIYSKFAGGDEEDKDQAPFNTNKQMLAQNDLNTAQTAAQNPPPGDSVWTSCPGVNRGGEWDGRCAGQVVCMTDEMGASQCISALPGGGDVTATFGASIYIIDNIQKNLFTLKGPQNDGVVYQDDGFVNIDKGGTTKMSVAGIGALITDFIMNRLFLGRGTTTYLGNGNADAGTYLTNTFILDYSSSVGVDAVNPTEQNRFKESTQIGNFKQDNELAFTVNQFSLKPYKNAVDIGNLQGQYQILTRGFSNIVLAEKDKIFPLMTRNFAKGDSLIVKNKGVKIPNTYLVNDGNYQYTIKTIGDSTKVLAKNGKVIQDSGPLGSQLSRRQAILVYNV